MVISWSASFQQRQPDAPAWIILMRIGLERRRSIRQPAGRAFFYFPDVDFLHQAIDHLAFGDGVELFAAFEDHALAAAGRDAEVGLARLAGAVDDAAQHADLDRRRAPLQAIFELSDDLFEIDLQPATGRAS